MAVRNKLLQQAALMALLACGGTGSEGGGGSPGSSEGGGGSSGGGSVAPLTECDDSMPEWVFCSGFEEGSKAIWDDYDGNPDSENKLVADAGPWGVAGNHVARLRVPAGRGGSDLVKLLPPHDLLYARWYVAYEPGFNFDAPNHGSALFAGDRNNLGRSGIRPDGTDVISAGVEYSPSLHVNSTYVYYRGMYQDCADPDGACWGDSLPCIYDEGQSYCTRAADRPVAGNAAPALQTGRWYCVELMLDAGFPSSSEDGAGGALDWWIDGQEMGPFRGLWMRTVPDLQVDILWLSLFHHDDQHSLLGVLYDDVVVSTARVGCR